jgi:hypothetical protein
VRKSAQRSVHSILLAVNKTRKGRGAAVHRALDQAVAAYCATVLKELSKVVTHSATGDSAAPSGGAEHAARKSAHACLELLTLTFPLLSQNVRNQTCVRVCVSLLVAVLSFVALVHAY